MKLTDEEKNLLVDACLEAKNNAYAKYSNFRVGAALLSEDGRIFKGCNVENVSYGLTICAERTAYVKAVSEGVQKFKGIAVCTDVKKKLVSPCGACRQFMSEFNDIEIVMTNNEKERKETKLSELLPMAFDDEALQNGQKNGIPT